MTCQGLLLTRQKFPLKRYTERFGHKPFKSRARTSQRMILKAPRPKTRVLNFFLRHAPLYKGKSPLSPKPQSLNPWDLAFGFKA